MANGNGGQNPHCILEGVTETQAYRYPGGRGGDQTGPSRSDSLSQFVEFVIQDSLNLPSVDTLKPLEELVD